MVRAHRAVAVVSPNHSVTVQGVPMASGERVEVIVLAPQSAAPSGSAEEIRERLRGSVLKYDDPFAPAVAPEEWDALR